MENEAQHPLQTLVYERIMRGWVKMGNFHEIGVYTEISWIEGNKELKNQIKVATIAQKLT